jgi:ribosomal protein S18 acetylase RimI-like enzyme
MIIEQAHIHDAQEILALQKLAYQSEAAIYNDDMLPPLMETLDEIRVEFAKQTFLKAISDEKIVGSVRAYVVNGTCHIGRLIVHPECQNLGMGTKLMQAIEQHFQAAKRFELFTGCKSERNLYLYQKLGYRIFKREDLNENVGLVYLEKSRVNGGKP